MNDIIGGLVSSANSSALLHNCGLAIRGEPVESGFACVSVGD